METSFSEVFSGDVLADKDPTQPSNPSTPASDTRGSQPASSRQPQGQAGQASREPVLPFSQVQPGRSTPGPHRTEGPLSQEDPDHGFEANVTDAFEGTAMKSGIGTSPKSFFILSPCYQVQHGGYN